MLEVLCGLPSSETTVFRDICATHEAIAGNLQKNGFDRSWLSDQLKEQGFDRPNAILAAMLDTRGRKNTFKHSGSVKRCNR